MTTRLTYGEQLRHPNWQKLRLERFAAAGWTCESCGSTETTLHLHHKRYIKGRMAWEYPSENFEVLCEACHGEAHVTLEKMQALLALVDHKAIERAIPLLVGYLYETLDPNDQVTFGYSDLHLMNVGVAARRIESSQFNVFDVCELSSSIGDPTFITELRDAMKRYSDRLMTEGGALG